jgi:hypothetical protein
MNVNGSADVLVGICSIAENLADEDVGAPGMNDHERITNQPANR